MELALQLTYVVQHFYEGYAINLPLEDLVRKNKFLVFELFGESLLPNHNEQMQSIGFHLSS
jgi:hypothetical protein